MEWSFRREGGGPSRRSLLNSVAFHAAVVVLAFLATLSPPRPNTFITYEIEIVSPPAAAVEVAEEPTAPEELVIERPEEAPSELDPLDVPPPEAEPEEVLPDPEPEEETEPDPEETPAEPAETPAATESEESSELSGEDIEVRMEGVRRDFPEYYANIVRQIRRCFRPPSGVPSGLQTVLYFVIRADGTVTDLTFVQQSGNPDLDFEAFGAVGDCAGKNGRFGPLPEELPYERLPIQFTFTPSGDGPDGAPRSNP